MKHDLALEEAPARSGRHSATHVVHGGGGVELNVREWGNPRGRPILLIHGWSQSQLCWARQIDGQLADEFRIVTFDNRGHGMSEKPAGAAHYVEGRLWADDVAAVIEETELERPTLVAWSYGGFIVADYLRAYGEAAIAGINLVGGAVVLRPPAFDHIGPGFLENASEACAPELGTATAAIVRFLHSCTAEPLGPELWDAALAWNMVVPAEVRASLLAREIDSDDVLASLSVPLLVTHGRADAIVLPSMADHVLRVCPTARASWYEEVGHAPFLEDASRFNRELAELVRDSG